MARVRQAGAVTYERERGACLFLVVTSRRNPEAWIFPKGHVHEGETPEDCAVRELREEAGVDGHVIDRLGSTSFTRDGKKFEVEYFLIRQTRKGGSREGRQRAWLSYPVARARLEHKGARKMLDGAARRLQLL